MFISYLNKFSNSISKSFVFVQTAWNNLKYVFAIIKISTFRSVRIKFEMILLFPTIFKYWQKTLICVRIVMFTYNQITQRKYASIASYISMSTKFNLQWLSIDQTKLKSDTTYFFLWRWISFVRFYTSTKSKYLNNRIKTISVKEINVIIRMKIIKS